MEKAIKQLQDLLNNYSEQLSGISEAEWTYKPNPVKWSKKEILGHLIDSAQNNVRRFVVAQYEDKPKITYAQDSWVAAADYQHYNTADLINLFMLINKHICAVLKNVPPGAEQRLCETGETHTIQWLAEDYNKHLLHHMHQVLNLEPIAYP